MDEIARNVRSFVFTFAEKQLYIIIMKQTIFIFFTAIILSLASAYADDWADFSGAGNLWDGQKSITNSEFEKAIDTLQGKQKQKEAKQKKRKIKKLSGGGTSLHSGLDPMSEIQAQDSLKNQDDEGQLLNIPVCLYVGENKLETGFYNVFGEKDDNGDIYLSFYQAHYLMGKIRANETKDDFGAEEINFVKLIPYNEDYVKIVFGSLDFNAFVYVRQADNQNND